MSTNGSATPRTTTYRNAGISDDLGPVLAQIPDLDPKAAPRPTRKRLDGRIISETLSVKLVFGVAIGLVIGAILPLVFGRGSRPPQPVKELPAWHSNPPTDPMTSNSAQSTAPLWTPAPPANITVAAPPQAPQIGDYRPAAISSPSWSRPDSTAAAPAASRPGSDADRGVARFDSPGSYAPNMDRRALQADSRNDAAARYRNDVRYDYRGNPVDVPPVNRGGQFSAPPPPASGYPDRYENYRTPASPGSARCRRTTPAAPLATAANRTSSRGCPLRRNHRPTPSQDVLMRRTGSSHNSSPQSRKRGQSPFAGTAQRVLRTNGGRPRFPRVAHESDHRRVARPAAHFQESGSSAFSLVSQSRRGAGTACRTGRANRRASDSHGGGNSGFDLHRRIAGRRLAGANAARFLDRRQTARACFDHRAYLAHHGNGPTANSRFVPRRRDQGAASTTSVADSGQCRWLAGGHKLLASAFAGRSRRLADDPQPPAERGADGH